MALNQHTLISLVGRCPPLWNRHHKQFRDQDFKSFLWTQIGKELALTGTNCKEIFKGLREKYIREREKQSLYGSNYRPWEFLDELNFLDPHIITRKSHTWAPTAEEMFIKQDPSESDHSYYERMGFSDTSQPDGKATLWSKEYFKALIKMVRDSNAIWDRQNKDYHDKQLKDHLWQAIARTLGCNVNHCVLRWKALREKYIRQKQKFVEGESKWELLDDLAFLDDVIQYRKRQCQFDEPHNSYVASDNSSVQSRTASDYDIPTDEHTNDSTPNHPTSSTSYQSTAFSTSPFSTNLPNSKQNSPDSTLDTLDEVQMRKRKTSDASASDVCHMKREKVDEQGRTPEQIFGEFVAAMLAAKPQNERHTAMMEIMSILAKPSTS